MMRLMDLQFLNGERRDLFFPSVRDNVIDASHLLALPALIDPHVHFRVPGGKAENWVCGAAAAISGGITTVLDMPNVTPPTTTAALLDAKVAQVEEELKLVNIPLRYGFYFGADKGHLDEIPKVKGRACAIKVFMGCSTGGLVIDDDETLEAVFQKAKASQMVVAVHAEDEATLRANKQKYAGIIDPAIHSKVRSREAAFIATEKAIKLARKYATPLYILHMSTKEEVELVRQAKAEGLPVFAECCSHHLFLSEKDYGEWKTFVQMNPPLRTEEDQEALWRGIADGTIDTVGTDHAPHLIEDKLKGYGEAPSGIPGVETLLPLLLDALNKKRLSLEKLVSFRRNIEQIFGLPSHDDLVLVDLNLTKKVYEAELKTKCRWSPFANLKLKGWPIFTVLKGKLYTASGYGY